MRSDLPLGQPLPVDLYHYLPLNKRYAIFLRAGQPFTEARATKLRDSHVRHLYVRESDLQPLLSSLRGVGGGTVTEQMAVLRGLYREWIISLFDCSTDGNEQSGHQLWRDGIAIVRGFGKLIDTYKNVRECLAELPYPRWSGIAHGMNTVVYAFIFGEVCGISHREDTAFAALIHNLGEAALDQEMLQQEQRQFSMSEAVEYRKHVDLAVQLIQSKALTATPVVIDAVKHHHENYDGSGYPDRLHGDQISMQAGLLSIIDAYDYYFTARPGKSSVSPEQAWAELKKRENWAVRFHPELIADLDKFFSRL